MLRKITALLLLFVAATGCNYNNSGKAEGSELEPSAHTLYTDKSELFVEFKPLIVGEASKFAAHFTLLGEEFKPLTEGTVTVSLVMGDKGIRNSAASPSSPGIYRLSLQPKIAGKGTLIFEIKTRDFTDRIEIPDVTIYPNQEAALKAQPSESASGDISFLKEQAWKIQFANERATKQPFSDVIKTSGQIISAPGDEVVISAKADGIVTFSGNKAIIGNAVNQGSSLFLISGDNLAQGNIDATVREARMSYHKLKADYERAEELAKDKIISQKEFQTTKLLYENARNEYNTVSKNYSAKGQNITAPMSGFIKTVNVTDGQFVQAGTPLATVSKNKRLLLQANVSQKYFAKLASVTSANFSLPDGKTYDTASLNGRVVSYGKSASTGSPFIPITFEIDNIVELISGSGVQIYLKSDAKSDALVIPYSSVMEEQSIFYVYVQTAGESFQKREITLGANDGKDVQILSGLSEGERVVTKGAYQIKLSSASGASPAHGHEH
ncbi:MAG: efflux RND transporter periplasmic adaptor subunit [Flavobacterium psychrophilum]|nr:MAG: efflux RND transporter periplasmic adaptor subunit [Flavobacterium psychrophilum]